MSAEVEHHEGSFAYDTASKALASLVPIGNINQHLCSFHINAQDRARHVEAHHFCNHKGDFYQIFKSLPEEEKKYWHSHQYEVESGLLYLETKVVMPSRLPYMIQAQQNLQVLGVVNDHAERHVMPHCQRSYGKAVHTWVIDKYPDSPLGPPQLMTSVTGDGQLGDEVVQERDNRLGISAELKREYRATYLCKYEKDEKADQWEKSETGIAFEPREVKLQD